MNNITARDQLIEQIKKSENILIALSSNPTIDELTSALGLTLILNKTNDHVTTIFSGEVPSVLNFLEPDKFFDKTVDGLRDFIIALNPEKADRVRTKVVDGMVRVSITPSQGAVTVDDLEFSQGDYNVDLVIALGVQSQADLDKALEAHGRILHSAFVASVSVGSVTSDLGTLNWQEPALQSYAQIVADLTLNLEPKLDENGQRTDTVLVDGAVANALMTGLVAVTDRFSNSFTTPEVMTLAAVLMGQGANQQLISKELEQVKEKAIEQSVVTEQPAASTDSENKLETETIIQNNDLSAQTADSTSADAEQMDELVDKIIESRQSQTESPDNKTSQVEPIEPQEELNEQDALTETKASSESKSVIEQQTDSTPEELETSQSKPVPQPQESEISLPGESEFKTPAQVPTSQYSTAKSDDSWEKVNQFKQAFLDKMKKTQEQAAQSRQEELNKIKQVEEPEPPRAEKTPLEVVELEKALSSNTISSHKSQKKITKDFLKKKPTKVINPLEKTPETGPSLTEQIAKELDPILPPVAPPLPNNAPLPPPLPPMPPDFDQITMTNLPPVETSAPHDMLKSPLTQASQPASAPISPVAPPLPNNAPLPPPLPSMPQPMAPPVQPSPQSPKQPVSQDQFVIPE